MTDVTRESVDELLRQRRNRQWLLTSALVATVLLVFGSMGAVLYLAPKIDGIVVFLIGGTLFLALAIPVLVWNYPIAGFYILFAGASLFEVTPSMGTITENVPFFVNVNVFARSHYIGGLDGLKFSPAEMVMVVTFLCWLVRTIARREHRFVAGPYFGWMAAYMVMVAAGFVHGLASGGDYLKALWEVRPQFYLMFAYLLAANMVTSRKEATVIVWLSVLCIGFKGILGAIKYFSMAQVSVDGVLTHEESLYFNILLFALIISGLVGANRRLTWVALLLTPTGILSTLANQRRAGIAAFIIAFVPFLPLMWCVLESKRRQIARFAVGFALFSAIYLPIAWNGKGAWALPARSIRSQSEPNERDAGSNVYRMMEDANLKFTRDLEPWFGFGFGKQYAEVYVMPEVTTDMLRIYAHNSVLWIWMRIGNVGFFAFMMMLATILIRGSQTLRSTRDPALLIPGVLAVLLVLMVFTFGKYDLQLVNYRTMWMLGVYVGILGVLPALDAQYRAAHPDAPPAQEPGEPTLDTSRALVAGRLAGP